MLPETLKNKIIKHLKDATGHDNWKLIEPKIIARECTVYRFSCNHLTTDMALKVYHDKQIPRKKFMHYDALERYAPRLNNDKSIFRVPVPHGCFLEDHSFLMEWVEGTALEERLWRVCYNKRKLQADINLAYQWLAVFHRNANPVSKAVNPQTYIQHLNKHIELYNGQKLLEKKSVFSNAYKILKTYASKFEGFETLHANAHGDFTFTNILLGDNHVTAIDIGGFSCEPLENDMALMLNYLCITYFNMLSKVDMKNPPQAWPIFKVVFESYGYSKDPKQVRFFVFVFLYQTLRRWTVINNRNLSQRTSIVEKWRLRNSALIAKGVSEALDNEFKI